MRIVVPIKQVPETNAVTMDEATGTMIREGVEAIVNPLDLYAIELAIRLREAHGGETLAVSMGPPKAQTALREALAMGIDSAVLLSDKAFAGSDTWATSYALAAAIRRLGAFDLVICGERATDGDTGQVGPGIAAWLDLPVATYVGRVERVADGAVTIEALLPASVLGTAPAAGATWRAAVAVQDAAPPDGPAMAAWPHAKTGYLLAGPAAWGLVRFVGVAAGE